MNRYNASTYTLHHNINSSACTEKTQSILNLLKIPFEAVVAEPRTERIVYATG